MPSPYYNVKRKGYALQRSASLGAGICLLAQAGSYVAYFESATRCASVLGKDRLGDLGDGLMEGIPRYEITFEEMQKSCQKLSAHYSVALLDYTLGKHNDGQFICLWRIDARGSVTPAETVKASTNIDDY